MENELFLPGQWVPDGPPEQILPPDFEPDIDLLTVRGEDYRRQYYLKSGRYLGNFETKADCGDLDPYRFSRK